MSLNVRLLPEDVYKGFKLPFRYVSAFYYDAEITQNDGAFSARFVKKPFETPFEHDDGGYDSLYQEFWPGARAFGAFVAEDGERGERGKKLAGCVEVWHEKWSNRLRVTEMWVDERFRRRGIGAALMTFAKEKAAEWGCRALMLETQSCNGGAVAFYLSQGLTFFGFDRSCYGNDDVERGEVRLELGLYL